MSTLIGQDVGRYHIIEQLGEGGMATVYKAFDSRLERQVAMKFIRRDAFIPQQLTDILKRFDREAKALARLSHSNIVKVYDYGEHDGAPYLVMEYLHGGSLKSRIGRPIPWREAVQLVLPITRALDYSHKRGILHRDVKPANILLNEASESQLSDFGIAKILELEGSTALTGMGVGVGTPEYMAPEQWTGKVVPQTDQYALGVVLYELVTGCKPYTADTPAAILLKQANEPLPRPKNFISELPDAVEQVIFKALAKDPQERYEDMGAFAMALENLLAKAQTAPKHILDESETFDDIGIADVLLASTVQAELVSPHITPPTPNAVVPILEEQISTYLEPKAAAKEGTRISGVRRWLLIGGLGAAALALIWGIILGSTVLLEQGRQGRGALAMLATETYTITPIPLTPTPLPTSTSTVTPTSQPTSAPCPKLLEPADGSLLLKWVKALTPTLSGSVISRALATVAASIRGDSTSTQDSINFSWEPYSSIAWNYRLQITGPNGESVFSNSYSTFASIPRETLPWQGKYIWQVLVQDDEGNVICTTLPYTFSKFDSTPTASP